MIRLIALDMDGTLLGPDHSISEKNIRAIRMAQNKGIEVMITTGRGYLDAKIPVEVAQLKLAFSCLNGAEVRDENGGILASSCIKSDELREVIHVFEKEDIAYDLFIGDYLYTRNIEDQITMYMHFNEHAFAGEERQIREEMQKRVEIGLIKEVNSYRELLKLNSDSVYKILGISTDEKKLLRAKKRIEKELFIAVSSSGIGNLEVTHYEAQKGVALRNYASKKRISMEEVMVIGDNFNDISMMKLAGIAVAMENAPDEVKNECDRITGSNEANGVALMINDVIQGRQ